MIRRLVRRSGVLAVSAWAWSHRGTVRRLVDAARHAPARVRSDRVSDVFTELRAIARLDRRPALARRTDLRIGAVGDGGVVLIAPPECAELEQARLALTGLPGVHDVRAMDPEAEPEQRETRPTRAPRAPLRPQSSGVVGEQPNRSGGVDGTPAIEPLDEHPLGHSPMETVVDAARRTGDGGEPNREERRAAPRR